VPEQLLAILKICLLVLLYLFFLRVVRAVWSELRVSGDDLGDVPPVGRRARRAKRAAPALPSRLVVRAPVDLLGTTLPLDGVITIGRSPTATLALEDGYLSQHHARVHGDQGGWVLEDLGSTNGTYLNEVRVDEPQHLALGDMVQLGGLIVEVQ